jgi:hypothetical protein
VNDGHDGRQPDATNSVGQTQTLAVKYAHTMDWVPLNVFQRLTRQWDAMHPYNAAQAMQLRGVADPDALKQAWRKTVIETGLGDVQVERGKFRYHPASAIEFINAPPSTPLDQLMSSELNRPFEHLTQLPLRAFVIRQEEHYFAGVVYHHWAADSFSIRMMLREWFLRLFDPAAARKNAWKLDAPRFWALFGPSQAGWSIGGGILEMFRWSARFRRARRLDAEHFRDLSVHFSLHEAPDALIPKVVAAARRRGVTVNDVFLAAMAVVCDRHVPVKRTDRRPDLALGTIVDLRRFARQSLDETFGLYLGFTSVFCRPADMADWDRLLGRVHQQNQMQKTSAAAESSMIRMLAGLMAAGTLSRKGLLKFYRKRLAMAAGISNVNLNREWPRPFHPDPLMQYIRVSPAGPMMPVVFTPTTLGRRLNIGLTCRRSVISDSDAPILAQDMIRRLQQFADEDVPSTTAGTVSGRY